MKLIEGFYLIVGGGKFGQQSYDILKQSATHHFIVIIDSDPNCLLGQMFLPSSLDLVQTSVTEFESSSKNKAFFLIGTLVDLSTILFENIPEFLIPTAPIHVMDEIMRYYTTNLIKKCMIDTHSPDFIKGLQLPTNLNIIKSNNELYFSYAPWDQKCPPNCNGTSNYCKFHDRVKTIDLNEYLIYLKSKYIDSLNMHWFNFESIQLAPGLGGIQGKTIMENLSMLEGIISDGHQTYPKVLITTTACKCHGVLSAHQIICLKK